MKFEEYLFNSLNNYSYTSLDEKLGLVFYPCQNAIKEALEKSMA